MSPKNSESDNDDVHKWQGGIENTLTRMDERLRVIERLVWTAVGGTAVVSAIAVIGISLISKQSERLDGVAIRQAETISERRMNESHFKQRDSEMQRQIEDLQRNSK